MDKEKKEAFKLTWKGKDINGLIPILLILLFAVELAAYSYYNWNHTYLFGRMLLFILIGIFCYLVRRGAGIHRIPMNQLEKKQKGVIWFVSLATCIVAFYTMTLSDWWTDDGPDYQFQYEELTTSMKNGHLYLDEEVSPELKAMENPYDSRMRSEQNVDFAWDHAYYNEHYYMYFGVVPVMILMLPLKMIGISLYSYQATQIFVIFAILGMFALFRKITEKLYPEMPLSGYLAISVATAWIAVWYAVKYPALYCTAYSSGVCMAIWGFYFCYRAFVIDTEEKKVILHGILGALFSALTFGCRPTIGFFCLSLVPLLFHYFKKCGSFKTFLKAFLPFCVPFLVVAVLLMLYNYARFENPFEFGQSYQLTIVDQTMYSDNKFKLSKCLNGLYYHFFYYVDVTESFPFIDYNGCFVLFPVLGIGLYTLGQNNRKNSEDTMIKGLAGSMFLAVIIISTYHVLWAPVIFRRYSMDFYFLLGFLTMFGVCGLYQNTKDTAKLSFWLTVLAAQTFVVCFLLLFVDFDYSIATYHRELFEKVRNLVVFWKQN